MIQLQTENAAVVAIVKPGRSKHSELAMHLFFGMVRFDMALVAV